MKFDPAIKMQLKKNNESIDQRRKLQLDNSVELSIYAKNDLNGEPLQK